MTFVLLFIPIDKQLLMNGFGAIIKALMLHRVDYFEAV